MVQVRQTEMVGWLRLASFPRKALVCILFMVLAWFLYSHRYAKAKPHIIRYNQDLLFPLIVHTWQVWSLI